LSEVQPKYEEPGRPLGRDLNREDFARDGMRDMVRQALARDGMQLMSEEAHLASLQSVYAAVAPGDDVWVFGYGSLMWNPAIEVCGSGKAHVDGFHRSFCLTLSGGRGTPELPGLMLGVDRGGALTGVAHRIAADAAESELSILWTREMLTGAYDAQWVNAEIEGQGAVRALTFVVNRGHQRYEGALDEEAAARRIAGAVGVLGSNRDYLYRTAQHLRDLGIDDHHVFRIEARVRALANEPNDQQENRI
jgi:glutathione-specific gamma-glutamylcyclotransferase